MPIRFQCLRDACRSDLCPAKQFYSCLSSEQDAELGHERLARRYDSGQIVVHHDTPALAILSVHSGQVKLSKSTSNGRVVIVGTRGPGELLGVREVLSGMPYQVSVETLEESVLCAVPREAFLGAVRDCPELAMRLLKQLANDYLLTEEQLVSRAHASVTARTARLLVLLTDASRARGGAKGEGLVSMGREEMALLVGTTRETLSRTIHRLAEQGAIALTNGTIGISDRPLLERLSEQ